MVLDIDKQLKEAGLKVTQARLAVLELLNNSSSPLNHTQIMDALPGKKNWDRVTIYRTLSEFEEKNIITSLHSNDRMKYYEIYKKGITGHGHIVCEICGKIECIYEDFLKLAYTLTPKFKVSNIEVLIKGTCKRCQ